MISHRRLWCIKFQYRNRQSISIFTGIYIYLLTSGLTMLSILKITAVLWGQTIKLHKLIWVVRSHVIDLEPAEQLGSKPLNYRASTRQSFFIYLYTQHQLMSHVQDNRHMFISHVRISVFRDGFEISSVTSQKSSILWQLKFRQISWCRPADVRKKKHKILYVIYEPEAVSVSVELGRLTNYLIYGFKLKNCVKREQNKIKHF